MQDLCLRLMFLLILIIIVFYLRLIMLLVIHLASHYVIALSSLHINRFVASNIII